MAAGSWDEQFRPIPAGHAEGPHQCKASSSYIFLSECLLKFSVLFAILYLHITTIFIMKLIIDLLVCKVNAELILPWVYSKVIKVEFY